MRDYDLHTLEALAMLTLTDRQRASLHQDMDALLSLCDRLADLPLSDCEDETDLPPRTRGDVVAPSLPREEMLAAAEAVVGGLISVPHSDEGRA